MDRFWSKVDKDGPGAEGRGRCWVWTAYTTPTGYGQFRLDRQHIFAAHRFAYELCVGGIPDGMELDHLCRNRRCVNPSHLEAVEHRTNVLRSAHWAPARASQTHCVNGHPFDAANTYHRPSRPGLRECRACKREHDRRTRRPA